MLSNKKASIVLYVMIVVFIGLIISYVVLDKMSILNNNLGLGLNSQKLQSEISKKGNRALELTNLSHTNSNTIFDRSMTCPSDVEVITNTGSWHVATFAEKKTNGDIVCKGKYYTENFEISFGTGKLKGVFTKVKKAAETINLQTVVPTKVTETIPYTLSVANSSNNANQNLAIDSDTNTYFSTDNAPLDYKEKFITLNVTPNQNISKITIKKPANYDFHYQYVFTYDSGQVIHSKNILFPKGETSQDFDLKTNNFDKKISKIQIIGTDRFENLAISDIKLDTFAITGQKLLWKTVSDFTAGNIKSIQFNSNSTTGNSQKISKSDFARLTFFGSVRAKSEYYNIFWNNYKTDTIITQNTNNNTSGYKKSPEVENAHFYLETQNATNFDVKIIEFDKQKYKNNELVQKGKFYEKNITTASGYISANSLETSTGTAINFDLKNNDYALFIKNKGNEPLNYKLTAKTASGANIYIHPIDDSGTGSISVVANHIITGPEKVYFGDNIKMEGRKYESNTPNFRPKTCLEILNTYPLLKNQDGYYVVYLDENTRENVYCDMTTSGGGWTRYVNIKGNYSFQNAKDCWLGNNIHNENLECFNPNRYGIAATQLMNNDWSGQYIFDIPTANVGAKVATQTTGHGWRCLGHNDYMSIMSSQTAYPNPDGSDTTYIWLGRNFCTHHRDTGGRSSNEALHKYMNYNDVHSTPIFGQAPGDREPTAKVTKLYFREAKPSGSSLDITPIKIESFGSGKRWDNGNHAKSCNEYRNPKAGYEYSGATGDGFYFLDSDGDGGKPPYLAYCDMTTSGGGWTRYVNIKGNYTFNDAKNCWLGQKINNANIDCFNPNRFGIIGKQLMNKDWSGQYIFNIPTDGHNKNITNYNGEGYYCSGNKYYMTIMKGGSFPNHDGSDTGYIRLGKSWCHQRYSPGGRTSLDTGNRFFNNDFAGNFGVTPGGREANAKNTELYVK